MSIVEEAPAMSEVESPTPVFVQPKVSRGQLVNFYTFQDPSAPPQPAIVFVVSEQTIELVILAGGAYRSSVRHKTDPHLENNPRYALDNGAWDYTEDQKTVERDRKLLFERMTALEKRVRELEAGK